MCPEYGPFSEISQQCKPGQNGKTGYVVCSQPSNQMVPVEENPDYGYMVIQLQELFDQALARYPLLLQQLQQHRKDGTELSEAFEADFG